jgi:hypothetical protein
LGAFGRPVTVRSLSANVGGLGRSTVPRPARD